MGLCSADMALWALLRIADGKSVGIWLQCIFKIRTPAFDFDVRLRGACQKNLLARPQIL